ncbi:DUF1178 family protein [Rhodalgimonas zhirmunskyi]|uniref:DUF1178 family protein n=1 Tax=Rhodalgimonas zhirmunskyi TaxID=2964767 RepID=A0AAJ1X4Y4_9RHOB|nr:DUF1178 family protein [Rhodoalgimonas zhirmunskyi]MDQ2093009.1 DUF1178 family protein [Rhodoalgimonas zhirmunskyi]
MIKFTLKCTDGHQFESWFQSADAFETLKTAGHVACAICGSADVAKALMAPRVRPGRNAASGAQPPETAPNRPLSTPANPGEQALAALKAHVEANSEYVGMEFAHEARAMHSGDAPARAIYGEAKLDEARALIEDGVPVAPLPFRPGRKTN